jgi:hypothetical protein
VPAFGAANDHLDGVSFMDGESILAAGRPMTPWTLEHRLLFVWHLSFL